MKRQSLRSIFFLHLSAASMFQRNKEMKPVLRNARNWIYVREYSNGAPTFPLFIFFISLVDDLRKPISIRIRPRSINDSLYSCQQRMQILLGYYILDTSYQTSFLGQNRICYS